MMCAESSTVVFPVGTVATAQMFDRSGPPAKRRWQPPEGAWMSTLTLETLPCDQVTSSTVRGTGAASARS